MYREDLDTFGGLAQLVERPLRISFFSLMGQGMLNFKFREFSGLKVINLHVPEEIDFGSWKFGPGAENQYQR